ncbi:unnamed protein product [Schistosoma turkestanicum]|nr:unnamed protein product [Schistosoma turkestanicum]
MLSCGAGPSRSNSYYLTVDSLRQGRVVGQFDKKFIMLVSNVRNHSQSSEELSSQPPDNGSKESYIIAVDQHAAHERILLECFEKECLNYFEILSSKEDHEIRFSKKTSLRLSKQSVPDIFDLIKHEPAKLRLLLKYGFSAVFHCSALEQSILVTMIPRVIPENHLSENLFKQVIISCLRPILVNTEEPKSTIIQHIMQAIHPLLESRACHQAIRFGNKLNKIQMKKLIIELSKCRIPFQCAHGRPTCTIITMINIKRHN